MRIYKSKNGRLPGSSHAEVIREARCEYHKVQKRAPRRQAYVRSQYFRKDKVFINQFWEHLKQKHPGDQLRRAKLFTCAIELIRHTVAASDTIYTYDNMNIGLQNPFHISLPAPNQPFPAAKTPALGDVAMATSSPAEAFSLGKYLV